MVGHCEQSFVSGSLEDSNAESSEEKTLLGVVSNHSLHKGDPHKPA